MEHLSCLRMESFSILSLTTTSCCDQSFTLFSVRNLWGAHHSLWKQERTPTASVRQFQCTFLWFQNSIFSQMKKGPKYCFDANANECKSTKSPFLQRSLCSVYLVAEHWEIESPLLVFPCKRRTKSDIQTNCQGLSGAHLSTKNTSFLQINSKWTTSVTFSLTCFCVGCFFFFKYPRNDHVLTYSW